MIHGATLPISGMMVDWAGELSVFIIASNALLRSSSRDFNASKLYPNPEGEKAQHPESAIQSNNPTSA